MQILVIPAKKPCAACLRRQKHLKRCKGLRKVSSAMCVGKEVERHQRCLQLFQQSLVRGKWSMLTRFGGHLPIKRSKQTGSTLCWCFSPG